MIGKHVKCPACAHIWQIPAAAAAAGAIPQPPQANHEWFDDAMNDEYRLAASPAPAPQPELPAPPRLARPEPRDHDTGFFAPEKKGVSKGVLGGLAMMTIAVVWFVAGYAAGYIFFYPPILFVIGLYALLKGILTGNLAGKD